MTAEPSSKSDVERALHDLREDDAIGLTDRQWVLLRYLVTEELEGRGDQIKAYSIAIDVFEPDSDFDPSKDSIVRVEMLRLRNLLDGYWEHHTATDMQISFQPGSYRPIISSVRSEDESHDEQDGPPLLSLRFWQHPSFYAAMIVVAIGGALAIWLMTPQNAIDGCTRPTVYVAPTDTTPDTRANLEELARRVLEVSQSYSLVTYTRDPEMCPDTPSFAMLLTQIGPQDDFQVELRSVDDNRRIWSESWPISVISSNQDSMLPIASSFYETSEYRGIITNNNFDTHWKNDSARDQYRCLINGLLLYYESENREPTEYFSCVHDAVSQNTEDSDILSLYLNFYLIYSPNELRPRSRLGNYLEPESVISELAINADRYVSRSDPKNLLYLIFQIGREKSESEELPDYQLLRILSSNLQASHPYHPEALYFSAIVDGVYLGDWNSASQKFHSAIEIRGATIGFSRLAVEAAIANRNWMEAHRLIENPPIMTDYPNDFLMRHAIARHTNDREMLASARLALLENNVRSRNDAMRLLRTAGWHRSLTDAIIDGFPESLKSP